MSIEVTLTILWLLFGGSHIVLAIGPVRKMLTSLFNEEQFTVAYSIVASVTFAILVVYYAGNRADSTAITPLAYGLIISSLSPLLITFGMVLLTSCVLEYANYPMAAFSRTVTAPKGLSRITRHPFLVANLFIFGPHLLMANNTADLIFFGGYIVFTALGIAHQDSKLLTRKGQSYRDYMETTSTTPFLAIIRGKQQLVLSELNWPLIALGVLGAVSLRYFHSSILAFHGIGFIVVMFVVGNIEVFLAWRANQQKKRVD